MASPTPHPPMILPATAETPERGPGEPEDQECSDGEFFRGGNQGHQAFRVIEEQEARSAAAR